MKLKQFILILGAMFILYQVVSSFKNEAETSQFNQEYTKYIQERIDNE